MELQGPRSKKKKKIDNSNWSPWSELHDDFLDEITKTLSAIDYLMFGCVCGSWRKYVEAYKKKFMASQPPLALFFSRNARRACYFYSIFDQRMYKATLPNLIGKSCLGISCGYLVLEDKKDREDSQIWLLNPFTRHELHFRKPPNRYSRVILAPLASPLPEFALIAFCNRQPYLQFCRSTDSNWTVHKYCEKFNDSHRNIPWTIEDAVVFKSRIFVLTSHNEIGVLQLKNSHPHATLVDVESCGNMTPGLNLMRCLVPGKQHLMMVDGNFFNGRVYELNFTKMQWVEVQNFGDQALFFNRTMSSGLCNLTRWQGSQTPCNCMYKLDHEGKYTARFLDGRNPMSLLIKGANCMTYASLRNAFWYFPHMSYSEVSLSDLSPKKNRSFLSLITS